MSSLDQVSINTGLKTHHKIINSYDLNLPTLLALSALASVGCSSSGSSSSEGADAGSTAGQMEGSSTEGGNTAGDESSTAGSSSVGESFPAFQGVFGIEEQTISGVRMLKLNAGFVESESRVFFGHQFLLGEDRCQEVLGGTSNLPPDNIGAGEVLVLSNADGTLAQLDERTGNGLINDYSVQLESITTEQSMGMMLDIPGDQYPALPTLSVQDLDALVGIQPAIGAEVTADTVYTWTPSIYPETLIGLELSAVVPGLGSAFLSCSLIDDGEFVFPEFFQGLLGDASTTNWSMRRSRYVEHVENGAYLEIARTVKTDIE